MSRSSSVAVPVLIAIAAVLLQGAGRPVDANGDSVEVFRGSEGGYQITVGVLPERPVAGAIHFTVTPLDARTSEPVLDARVTLVAHDPDGRAAFEAPALNTPRSPRYYDANMTLHPAGEWTLVVEVTTEALGRATFSVPLRVGDAPLGPAAGGTVAWAVAIALFAGGGAYVWYSADRARRRRGSG